MAFCGARLGKGAIFLDLVLLLSDMEDSGVVDLECEVGGNAFGVDDGDEFTAKIGRPTFVVEVDRDRIKAG